MTYIPAVNHNSHTQAPSLRFETVLNVCAPPNYVFIKCEEEELRWRYQLRIDRKTRKFTALRREIFDLVCWRRYPAKLRNIILVSRVIEMYSLHKEYLYMESLLLLNPDSTNTIISETLLCMCAHLLLSSVVKVTERCVLKLTAAVSAVTPHLVMFHIVTQLLFIWTLWCLLLWNSSIYVEACKWAMQEFALHSTISVLL